MYFLLSLKKIFSKWNKILSGLNLETNFLTLLLHKILKEELKFGVHLMLTITDTWVLHNWIRHVEMYSSFLKFSILNQLLWELIKQQRINLRQNPQLVTITFQRHNSDTFYSILDSITNTGLLLTKLTQMMTDVSRNKSFQRQFHC